MVVLIMSSYRAEFDPPVDVSQIMYGILRLRLAYMGDNLKFFYLIPVDTWDLEQLRESSYCHYGLALPLGFSLVGRVPASYPTLSLAVLPLFAI